MRTIGMKRKLEKELPYPKITPRANHRIDQVLAALPDKEPLTETAVSIEDWDDFSQFVPMEEEKRSVAGAVFRWALACAAVALVSLVALNVLSPQTAESLPGVGNAFKSVNGFFNGETATPAPVPSPSPSPSASPTAEQVACLPLPVEDNGTTLAKIERDSSVVTVTAQVPYLGRVRESLRSDDYFDYTLLGTTAQLTRFGEDGQLADSTQVEGERMEIIGEGYQVFHKLPTLLDQPGVPRTVTWTFQNLEVPENGQMVLTLFEKAPLSEGELDRPNRVTAQFVVDLNAQKAAPADYSREMGFVKAAPEEVLAAPKLGEFTKGWYATEPTVAKIIEGERRYYKDTEYYKVVFYQQGVEVKSVSDQYYLHPDWDPATLRVYLDGELKTEITARSKKDLEDSGVEFTRRDGGFLDESIANAKYNELENGVVYDDTRWFTHGAYRRLAFGVPASVLGAKEGELEGLLSRLRFAFECNGEEVFFDVSEACKEQQAQADEAYAALCGGKVSDPKSSAPDSAPDPNSAPDPGNLDEPDTPTPTPGPDDHDDENHTQTESGAGNETANSRPPVIACPTPQPYDVWLANNPTPTPSPTPYAMCSGYPTPDPGQYDDNLIDSASSTPE